MFAYCYSSGLIEFGSTVPKGAIVIASGKPKVLREQVDAVARHGYKTEKVNGRPTKVAGTDCLLVPGIPEAMGDQRKGLVALDRFKDWIKPTFVKHGLEMAAVLLAVALLAPSTADAGPRRHFSDHYGFGQRTFYGWNVPGCKGWPCLSNNALVLTVDPDRVNWNTNPNWGRGCRSCADVSK